jgi:hypothetical protein
MNEQQAQERFERFTQFATEVFTNPQLVVDLSVMHTAFTARIRPLLLRVSYKPWLTTSDGNPVYRLLFALDREIEQGRYFLQVESTRVDCMTMRNGVGRGGKAYLSPHMTDSEIVQTAFGLFKAYEEHEAREGFLYEGRRIYGPHIDVNALVEVAERTDVRPVKL